MSNNKSDQLQLEIPDQTTEINEQPIEQPTEPDIKTKKGKTYIKKGPIVGVDLHIQIKLQLTVYQWILIIIKSIMLRKMR